MKTNAYRPEIDGLRAVAVLVVVAYHAFPKTIKGGFIGVDIFFVISGFLISGIILNDLQEGAFSFWNFYSRRIRRIFPALLFVLAAVLVFGRFALFPDEYQALGRHIYGGASFISNFISWREAGYFDVAARAKPLLHLWSLGIEEQFYIVAPLLLWGCFKTNLRMATVIVSLCFLSFLVNMHYRPDPTANFYNPLARVWELMAGATLCLARRPASAKELYLKLDALAGKLIYVKEPKNDGRNLSFLLALLGVILLACSLRLVRDSRPYPGWQAILPVMGTVSLIAAGSSNVISKHLLANRWAVFMGLVSYPFYLWHWPLISYAFIINEGLEADTRLMRLGIVFVSFILAVLTHILVEKPIRFGLRARTGKTYALIGGMLAIGILGAVVRHNHGFPARTGVDLASHFEWRPEYSRSPACQKIFNVKDSYCAMADEEAAPTAALIGDSFANAYFPGFAEEFRRRGENLVQLGAGGCPPLLDIASGPAPAELNDWCQGRTSRAIREAAGMPLVHTVLLAADWSLYVKGKRLNGQYNDSWQIRHLSPEDKDGTNVEVFEEQLRKTLDLLVNSGKTVIVLKQPPAFPFNPIDCLLKRPLTFSNKNKPCQISAAEEKNYLQEYELMLDNILAGYKNIKALDPFDLFFINGQSALSKDNIPLYRDSVHISAFGSAYVARELMRP